MKEVLNSKNAPSAIGPYVQAVCVGNIVYTSGQLGIDVSTGKLVEGIEAQAHAVMKNVGEILKERNIGYQDIVKTTIFLDSLENFATVNKIYESYFDGKFPARSCFEVSKLPLGGLVEIECIAHIK